MKYDISNIRKGMLVAKRRVPARSGKGVEWEAQCDCGNICFVRYSNFQANRHTSCGCRGIKEPVPGETFGKWTVQNKVYINGRKKFECVCECGNVGTPTASELRGGRSKMCIGCGHKINVEFGRAARNRLYKSYRQNALRRGYVHELSNKEMDDLFSSECHYCGSPPSQSISTSGGTVIYNGIDRKDNALGYTVQNCVPCCAICNRAKREISYDDFVAWIHRLVSQTPPTRR